MQSTLENFITMAVAAATKCHNNQSVVDSSPTFKASLDKVDAKIAAIQVVQQARAKSTKGLTTDKKQKRVAAAVVCKAVAKAITSYAFDNALTDLLKSAAIDNQKLLKGRDSIALDTLKYFHSLGKSYESKILDYGVTAEKLTDFGKLIDAYEIAIPAVRNHRVALKNATAKTKLLCKELDEMLVNSLDAGMEQFLESHPDFYNEYFAARIIIDLRGPSTGIKGNVSDKLSKLKIKKAKITLLEVNEQRLTTKTGNFSFKKLSPGIYTMVIEMKGYQAITLQNIIVESGVLTSVNIQMLKTGAQSNIAA